MQTSHSLATCGYAHLNHNIQRLRQEDCELEIILRYIIIPCQQDKNKKTFQKNIAVQKCKRKWAKLCACN